MATSGIIPGTPETIALLAVLSLIFSIEIYSLLKKLYSFIKRTKALDGK